MNSKFFRWSEEHKNECFLYFHHLIIIFWWLATTEKVNIKSANKILQIKKELTSQNNKHTYLRRNDKKKHINWSKSKHIFQPSLYSSFTQPQEASVPVRQVDRARANVRAHAVRGGGGATEARDQEPAEQSGPQEGPRQAAQPESRGVQALASGRHWRPEQRFAGHRPTWHYRRRHTGRYGALGGDATAGQQRRCEWTMKMYLYLLFFFIIFEVGSIEVWLRFSILIVLMYIYMCIIIQSATRLYFY